MKLRIQAFPFLADPPVPFEEKYKGIIEYPGFHTTTDFEIAALYAIGRVHANFTEENDDIYYVTDYPVVVQITTEGHEKHTDYDAEKIVLENIENHLDQIINHNNITLDMADEEIMEIFQNELDNWEYQSEANPNDVYQLIEEQTFQHFNNPLYNILNHKDAIAAIKGYIQHKTIPDNVLMDVTQQYRYTEDIDEANVTAIWYVTPVAEEMVQDPEDTTVDDKYPGFEVAWEDDVYSGSVPISSTLVWGTPTGKDSAEYHGTTYLRLMSAYPGLNIKEPPNPPFSA